MTTQMNTKVRLVRCPRCRKVLAELPEVSVYKCGGCGTILQAKNRRPETKDTKLSSQEPDSVARSQQDNISGQEDRSSNHDSTGSPEVESLPDKDNVRSQDVHDESVELSQDRSVLDGFSSSPDVSCPRTEDSPEEVKESLEYNPLGENPKIYQNELHDVNGERTTGPNFSNDLPSSGDIALEDEAYCPEASEHVEQKNHSNQHQDSRVDQMEDGESERAWQEGDNLVDEIQNLSEHEDEDSVLPDVIKDNCVPPENDEMSETCSADQIGESNGGIKHTDPAHEISPSEEPVDDGSKSPPAFRSSSKEKKMTPSGSFVSFYLTCDDDHLDHSPTEVGHNFERLSSIDTLGSSHLADVSSDLNFKRGSMNYSTNGSYYAYDGSESSYDGTDYQIHEHISHPSRKNKDVDYIGTTEVLRKDGLRGNNVVNSEPEMNYWAASSSHRAMRSRHCSRGETTETNRYASGHRMRLEQGDVSGLPFASRDPIAGHRTVRAAGYRHSSLPPRPVINLPDKPSCSEPDKIDLLRKVCELQEQLNRMHFPKVAPNRRFRDGNMDGKFSPFHYDHLAPDRETYGDPSDPHGYNPRHYRAEGCADRCNVSRLAFSGEAAHYRHQVSCSCLYCCPQDWHYSAQLPSRSVHWKNGYHVVHGDHSCCNISNSSSPHQYAGSELSSWGCETKSDSQRHDEMKRLLLREKYHMAKRHLRPLAGGAPVVACYHCLELLQLPADFLPFKKRYHRLMCNACRKVLKFSLQKGTHIVPYIPSASAPPPSETDDYSVATRQRNLKPLSHSSSCQHAEPVSCSDDYGQSFCRSCSTEGEASVIVPTFDRNSYNRKMSSGSSYEPVEDRKMKGILKEPQSTKEGSPNSVESVGPSSRAPKWSKSTSEIEELPPSSNSPLHRLMGYSSPSQVLDR